MTRQRRVILLAGCFLAMFITAQIIPGTGSLWAATASEIFQMLPDAECGGFSRAERESLLAMNVDSNLVAGQSASPDVTYPWVRTVATNFLELHRPGYGPITYKVYEGQGFQLMAVCRGRQRTAPMDPDCRFNLCFYRLDSTGLSRVDPLDYLPPVSILDYITPDMLDDPLARADIARRGPGYPDCLTCVAGIHGNLTLDLITLTTLNSGVCATFLPPYGLLPLTWNGREFTKPYDRAAPVGQ
ncbi:MAG: hypothetical protein LBV79_10820 [Candidatus Adiutrix sp.]|jgi:hypothetical protein|nr:hypothetical protein [Candidatus Adiutrix sp.]